MKELTTYALEVLVCSGVLLGIYAILLERQVQFRWCRIYLLAAMAIAGLIPALQIPIWPGEVITVPVPIVTDPLLEEWIAAPIAEPVFEITAEVVATGIYLFGAGLIFGVMIWQTIRIHRLRRGADISRNKKFTLVRTPQKISSFSFFHSIFIWKQTTEEEFPAIIAHESSHIAHRHSVERIVMECLKAGMWWNPFVWIAARRLTEVEEYEADSDVLNSGYDIQNYMQILLKQLFGYTPQIANGLRDSLTKKRFKMMTNNTNGRHTLLRLAGTLPAVIALLCAFGFTSRAAVIVTQQTPVEVVTDTLATTPATLPASAAQEQPTTSEMCTVQIQVYAQQSAEDMKEPVPIQGAVIVIGKSDVGSITDKQGRATITAPQGSQLKIMHIGYNSVYVEVTKSEQMVCKVPLTQEDPNVITSVDLRYRTNKDSLKLIPRPLYIIDGVEVKDLNSIAPNQILELSVLKDKSSVAKYGERAANGVVVVVTKAAAAARMSGSEKEQLKQTTITTPSKIDNDEPFVTAETMPSFQGGSLVSFRQWVHSQIKYPAKAMTQGIQGRVVLAFVIERDGSVSDIHTLASPDETLSEEAQRVILSSPKWTPGQQRGQTVRVRYTVPIDFQLTGGSQEKPEAGASEAESSPKFQNGGINEFRQWVQQNIRYPSEALNSGIGGRVVVEFTVGKDGSVKTGKVLQTPDKTLSKEVLRVLAKSPEWTPGAEKGKAVSVKYTIPIEFGISGKEGIDSGNQQKKVQGNIPEIIVIGYGTLKK